MSQQLKAVLQAFAPVPDEEVAKLLRLAREITIKKGEYFVREGQVPRKFGFVVSGLFRYLYMNQKGTEYTKNFIPESQFITAYSAMISGQPSRMFIEALEDSVVLEIQYTDWQKLRLVHPVWNLFLVALLEKAFTIKENRERELLLSDAAERYALFLQEFPGLENRVKQRQIASYLGISPVSLSRIRH